MKRSFYEMLEVPHDADQPQIEMAYALATAKLNAANLRGVAEAANEVQLIRDGYQILSDPAKRARYDAKLRAAETGVQLMFFPEGETAHKKLGVETVIFAALASVLTYVVYQQLVTRVDTVRVEHGQAVTRHIQDKSKAVSLDPTEANPSDVRVIVKDDEKRSGPQK